MKEINKFIDPILVDAIAKRKEEVESGVDKKDVSDKDTLLSYLIRHTQGTGWNLVQNDEILTEMWRSQNP